MNHANQSATLAVAALLISVAFLQGDRQCARGKQPENNISRSGVYQAEESSREMEKAVAGHKLCYLLQTPSGKKPKAG